MTQDTKQVFVQNAYLFVWNPEKWSAWMSSNNVPYIQKNIEELANTGKVTLMWSCRSHRSVKPGDRAFLAKVGSQGRGIFGSGKVISEAFLSKHWSGDGKDVPRVLIEFDALIHPESEEILTIENLREGNLGRQQWTPQSSGISIQPEVRDELEEKWFKFLGRKETIHSPFESAVEVEQMYVEGAATQITQTRYERNVYARKQCLNHYGYSCSVCSFNFEKTYGILGYQFIHVHHLTKVATQKCEYSIDPIKDLRPVCANCHAMLHKQNPPLAIEELKVLIGSIQ